MSTSLPFCLCQTTCVSHYIISHRVIKSCCKMEGRWYLDSSTAEPIRTGSLFVHLGGFYWRNLGWSNFCLALNITFTLWFCLYKPFTVVWLTTISKDECSQRDLIWSFGFNHQWKYSIFHHGDSLLFAKEIALLKSMENHRKTTLHIVLFPVQNVSSMCMPICGIDASCSNKRNIPKL